MLFGRLTERAQRVLAHAQEEAAVIRDEIKALKHESEMEHDE